MEKHINYPALPTALKIRLRYLICDEWRGRISITETGNRFINIEFMTANMRHVFTDQLKISGDINPAAIADQALQDVKDYLYDRYFKGKNR